MNEFGFKLRIFFTALFSGLGSILPGLGCKGVCGSCFQCAGFGGVLAVLFAIRASRRKNIKKKVAF